MAAKRQSDQAESIAAYCAQSVVLEANDVSWSEMSSGGLIEVRLAHVPTKTAVIVAEAAGDRRRRRGGRTSVEAKEVRAALYREGLPRLEREVTEVFREARRQNFLRPG